MIGCDMAIRYVRKRQSSGVIADGRKAAAASFK
jgi:hypothetical protein